MGAALQPPAQQLLAGAADDRADRLVDAHEPALGVELDDADRGMLVGRGPALLLLAQIVLAAVERIDHALALGDVLEAVDGADQLALRIEQRIDVEQHDDLLAVGALDRHLLVADRPAGLQHLGELGARQLLALAAEELALRGELVVGLARLRRAAPELHGALVVLHDPAGGVADAGRDRQQFEDFVGGPQRLFQRQRKHRSAALFDLGVVHPALLHRRCCRSITLPVKPAPATVVHAPAPVLIVHRTDSIAD